MSGEAGQLGDRLRATWLGTTEYGAALDLQRKLVEQRKQDLVPDSLLMLEHPNVVTLGRRADETHLVTDRQALERLGVQIYETDRGGEATFHGPGQLVAYPILDVRSANLGPVAYVRMLERTIIEALSEYGITAHLVDGETGVWVDGVPDEKRVDDRNPKGKKIAAIGVRISGGVTMHGLALNVSTDLRYFQHIIPCGMPDLPFTSVEEELGSPVGVRECADVLAGKLADYLGKTLDWTAVEIPTR